MVTSVGLRRDLITNSDEWREFVVCLMRSHLESAVL